MNERKASAAEMANKFALYWSRTNVLRETPENTEVLAYRHNHANLEQSQRVSWHKVTMTNFPMTQWKCGGKFVVFTVWPTSENYAHPARM